MQRLAVLVIIALLGIAPIGIVGRSASAQGSPTPQPSSCSPMPGEEGVSRPWEGVCRPIPEDATIAAPYQPYAVVFKEEFAATEVIRAGDAEYMIVRVKEGSFALDLEPGSPPVVVSTPQDRIETLTTWVAEEPHYSTPAPSGAPLMFNGAVCTLGCPVDPDVPVLLVPGDVAIAEKGALCIYCLLHSSTGLLEVFVLLDAGVDPQDFTWIRDWNAAALEAAAATPSASSEPVVMAWAFFNPPSKCDH